jgi:hypothetical protein
MAICYPQRTCAEPPWSSQLQPLKARFTQVQLALVAHSGSQPHAGPPGALSSQYQPVGHRASPQGLQVPSSQRGLAGSEVALLSVSSSVPSLLALSESAPLSDVLSLEELGDSALGADPPQEAKARMKRSVVARSKPSSIGKERSADA